MRLPPALERLRRDARGCDWLAALPGVVDDCAERWELLPGDPFPDAQVSLALRNASEQGGSPPRPSHGDVPRGGREPWLAIDPKPLTGCVLVVRSSARSGSPLAERGRSCADSTG